MIATDTRNATLAQLAELLKDQQAAKVDFVAPSTALRMTDGLLHVRGVEPEITDDGVTLADGVYRPSAVMDAGIAAALDVPVTYLRRLRATRIDVYDLTVNRLLAGLTRRAADGTSAVVYPADPRSFLIRAFRDTDGGHGYGRAWLSSKFWMIDNLDVLTAALTGIRAAGVEAQVTGCDLTDSTMHVRVACPSVQALAPTLLKGYRSPFGQGAVRAGGTEPGSEYDGPPIVFAGFSLRNSEVGRGRFTITPVITVLACTNGMTFTSDQLGRTHLGGRLDDGIVTWGADTQAKATELVTLQARDAVQSFVNPDYLAAKVAELEALAGAPVTDPNATVKRLGSQLKLPAETTDAILAHFVMGGQMTAAGIGNAITSVAQTLPDADAAWDLEALAVRAMSLAA